jgi:cytochrome c-type biogenesis protein CcmH/NrfF
MHRLKRSLLFFVLIGAAAVQITTAQTESQIESDEVKRVGTHINCQCGSCNENVNCNMSSGQCHFCKPARTKIWELQKSGMDDNAIVAFFKKTYGEGIFRADPNSYFWIVPYLALLAGAGVFWLVIKRMRASAINRPAVAGGAPHGDVPDGIPDKYRAAAEKESEHID